MTRRGGVIALLALGVLAGCGPGSAGAAGNGRLAVVAAENPWGDIAAQVGGERVSVTSIITDPAADPHTYESDARDAAAVASASLVIENGAGYDDFIDKLLGADAGTGRDVLNVAHVVHVAGASPDPHLWYDPQDVTAAARAMAEHLARADPPDAAAFTANLDAFLAAYRPYIDTLATIRSRYAGVPVGYTERVPGYLVQQAGLRLATPASFARAIEDGNDPSPGDIAAMDAAIEGRRIRLLLYNEQVTSPATDGVRMLATAHSVPVVGVAETIPRGEPSFQAWQVDQARAILAALGG